MSAAQPIRLLLVDDHEVVRVGLKKVLEADLQIVVVGEAATAGEAVTRAQADRPDVVLMDIRLPDGDGIQACRDILAACPGVRVLFLTAFADDETVLAAVLAGAHGFCVKRMDIESLVQSIKRVAAGESVLDRVATQRMLDWVRGGGVPPAGQQSLSPQEQRIVALVAEGKTNKEIAQELQLSPNTVKNYLSNAFQKLQITRRAQAVALFHKSPRS
jgi:two-component system, NarL family, response regulator DevR